MTVLQANAEMDATAAAKEIYVLRFEAFGSAWQASKIKWRRWNEWHSATPEVNWMPLCINTFFAP
ncbi:MAG: hypothetical protein ACOH2B_01505 [Burkholderiaceae bacterium]